MECNICGSTSFTDFAGRKDAMCVECESMERNRAMQLMIDRFGLAKPGMRAFHLAPERGISKRLEEMLGDGYEAYDLDVSRYPTTRAKEFDVLAGAESLPSRHYDLIIHSHVMEHLLGNWTAVLFHLHRALKDDGAHVFSLPIISGLFE